MSATTILLDEVGPRRAIGGHHSAGAKTHTWLTPPAILDALGQFDLDPCACPEPRPWPTAATMWTREDGPLARPWPKAARIWMNPPFGPRSTLSAFMNRMAQHGRGTALLYARTETDLFFSTVWQRATAVLFLRGRINFYHQDGRRAQANSGAPVVLIAYGADDAARLADAGLNGKLVVIAE